MNKIIVVDDKDENIKINNNIDFNIETYDTLFSITNIRIEIKNDEELYFIIMSDRKKYKVNVDVNAGVHANIYFLESIKDSKIQYSFTLSEKANLIIQHFSKNILSKQMIEVNLIGEGSCFNYHIKKICHDKETSDFYIHHCGNESVSNLTGDITSLKNGIVSMQLSTFIEEDCYNANTIQSLRVLEYQGGKESLKPNLYIDNNTATINHNNEISILDEYNEDDFMINEIYNKNLKLEVAEFLEKIGRDKDE